MVKILLDKIKRDLKIDIKTFEKTVMIIIVACSFLFLFVCFNCDGAGYHEGFGDYALAQNKGICKIDGKTIFYVGDSVYVSFLQLLLKGADRVYTDGPDGVLRVSRIFYEKNTGEKVDIITFKNPEDFRWRSIGELSVQTISEFVIVEYSDYIALYYDLEPIGGFVVEHNPFPKKFKFVQTDELWKFREIKDACFYY